MEKPDIKWLQNTVKLLVQNEGKEIIRKFRKGRKGDFHNIAYGSIAWDAIKTHTSHRASQESNLESSDP